ncbi:unnamed protein product [Bursaphelenchus xylophilus]|uniref:(pine wood nematode) hypothetical protein n=1 Tax=Bursaphelenchus xylophilus TaxID=6326 RepID=A0A1I7RM83_BURXY|nr:unnamed protein product [Bursaphelenchus xylophilus]CAG9118286.1 unnamed protein product [Bursaphelenchus xylophilus]
MRGNDDKVGPGLTMRSITIALTSILITIAETSVCPDAGTAAGPCFEGECNDGYICSDTGFCCPEVQNFDVQADSSDKKKTTKKLTTKKLSTIKILCVDGALNCGMFVGYCAPGSMYTWCMYSHCRRTCGLC